MQSVAATGSTSENSVEMAVVLKCVVKDDIDRFRNLMAQANGTDFDVLQAIASLSQQNIGHVAAAYGAISCLTAILDAKPAVIKSIDASGRTCVK